MRKLAYFIIIFLALTGAVTLLTEFTNLEFGTENYWEHHGLLFLIFITIFPRLTLLLSSVPFGGLFWWLGFVFAPRILVAILATVEYVHSNPILVVISWVVALSGETGEKYIVRERIRVVRRPAQASRGETIEAEYHRVDE